ncbi:hypothetical protein Ddc_16808 [Ditylenchus destructor]|nr:hypothetical protein Ddc_16808 [Ditylenchus destructor]
MKYYFTLLILAVVPLANAFSGPGRNNTAEKERLNAKILKEFPKILSIISPKDDLYNAKSPIDGLVATVDNILEDLYQEGSFPGNYDEVLLVLDRTFGVVLYDKGYMDSEPNLLAPFLFPPKYTQAGYTNIPETIDKFMVELAERYFDLFKEDGEEKEIHVVPIAKVKDELNDFKSGPVIVFGVLGRKKSACADRLLGIAGITAHIEY